MCGIAGILGTGSASPAAREARVKEMLAVLRHRGPDDEGLMSEQLPGGGLTLGHRRLSVLDTSPAGHQPMEASDGRTVVVYNGEIYNFVELRGELGGRQCFRTGTDTEVILAAYRRWGREMLTRFDGVFALLLWDRDSRVLLCARDPLGVKPLYWGRRGGEIVLASEPRAVLAGLGTPGHVDAVRLAEFLTLGVTDHDDGTLFQEVRQLRGGAWMELDAAGQVGRAGTFWRPPDLVIDPGPGLPAELADRLGLTVERQLRSDVPLGSCLSGGLDSGALVALAAQRLGPAARDYTALTIRNPGFVDDEATQAEATARMAGVRWLPVDVAADHLADEVEGMAVAMGEPFSTLSMFAQYKVMQAAAARGMKVMLDGQGGDEVYVGYERIVQRAISDALTTRGVGSAWREARALANHTSIALPRLLADVVFFSSPRPALLRSSRRLAGVVAGELLTLAREQVAERVFNRGGLREAQLEELTGTCLPRLLRYEDRNSMVFSVEARVPHLGLSVLDLALRLPVSWQVRDGWSKYALRRAVEPLLPTSVVWSTRKRGFDVPQARWVGALAPRIATWIQALPEHGPLRRDKLLRRLKAGKMSSYSDWRLLSVALWAKTTGVAW